MGQASTPRNARARWIPWIDADQIPPDGATTGTPRRSAPARCRARSKRTASGMSAGDRGQTRPGGPAGGVGYVAGGVIGVAGRAGNIPGSRDRLAAGWESVADGREAGTGARACFAGGLVCSADGAIGLAGRVHRPAVAHVCIAVSRVGVAATMSGVVNGLARTATACAFRANSGYNVSCGVRGDACAHARVMIAGADVAAAVRAKRADRRTARAGCTMASSRAQTRLRVGGRCAWWCRSAGPGCKRDRAVCKRVDRARKRR